MAIEIEKLNWDSDFLGYPVAKIEERSLSNNELEALEDKILNSDYRLAYYISDFKINESLFKKLEVKLVDVKTTFEKKLSENTYIHPSIIPFKENSPTDKMNELAIQTGIYSRFNIDPYIGKNKYEELYKIWLDKSVKKEMAKEVLVYMLEEKIVAYAVMTDAKGIANISIAAVDTNYRGMGIGLDIFRSCEGWAVQNGYTDIQIIAQGANKVACNLYLKLGYSIVTEKYFYHMWNKKVSRKSEN